MYLRHSPAEQCGKGKGYGTQAERLALRFVFDELGMTTVLADAIRENTRSQHVLKKGGFRFVGEDEIFRYYCIDRSIRPGGKIAGFLPAPFQSRYFRDIISLYEKNEDTGRRKNAVAGRSPG